MNEQTKRRLMGNWLYSIYRRTRYLWYLSRVKKIRKREAKKEDLLEAASFRKNLTRQKARELKETGHRRRQIKLEQKRERLAHNAARKEQQKLEISREKKKKQIEKEEFRRLRAETRQAMKAKAREEKALEQQQARLLRSETAKQKKEMKARLKEKATQDRALIILQKKQKKEERRIRKRRIRQLRPYLLRRRTRETLRSIRSIDRETLKRWFNWMIHLVENRMERNRFIKITLNSLSLFVLAYLTLYIAGEMMTLYAAQTFDYKMILFYYKIYYNIDSDQWTPDAVKILYSIKPLTGIVLGVVAMIIYTSIHNEKQVFKLYFLWLFIHGMVMFFGSLLMGTLLNQGFGWVIAYLYYRDTGKMVFSIISIFALVVTGTSIARSFLLSGNTYFNFINRDNRRFLLVSQVLIPAVLGTVITALMKVPNELYYTTSEEVLFEVFKLSTIIIVLIPVILSFSSFSAVFFDEEPRKVKFYWAYILIFVIIYFGYRLLLMDGIEIMGNQ